MIIGTILGCVAGIKPSVGYGLFVASKLIIGFGITAFMMTAQIMLQEIGHPRYRAVTAALWDGNFEIHGRHNYGICHKDGSRHAHHTAFSLNSSHKLI